MNIVLFGITGRMGREIIQSACRLAEGGEDISVLGGIEGAGSDSVGTELPGVKLPVSDSWIPAFDEADVIIDFSVPEGTRAALAAAESKEIPLLSGTTGLGKEFDQLFENASKVTAVIRASNTSVGINVMLQLVEQASQLLGSSYDAELVELHHRYKTDSPSGTAYSLLETLAAARNQALEEVASFGRHGEGLSRAQDEIGTQAVRGGDVAGEHTVYFFGEGERIEITHRATSRTIFADGAVRAAHLVGEFVSLSGKVCGTLHDARCPKREIGGATALLAFRKIQTD